MSIEISRKMYDRLKVIAIKNLNRKGIEHLTISEIVTTAYLAGINHAVELLDNQYQLKDR